MAAAPLRLTLRPRATLHEALAPAGPLRDRQRGARLSCRESTIMLPVLQSRGEYPLWDHYLSAVFADGASLPVAAYPIDLSERLHWLYRCACAPQSGQHYYLDKKSCQPQPNITCRYWLRSPRCARFPTAPSLANFRPTGYWVHDHVELATRLQRTPLAPHVGVAYVDDIAEALPFITDRTTLLHQQHGASARVQQFGMWLVAGRDFMKARRSFLREEWTEVTRIKQRMDGPNSTWYFAARGSGIWLQMGRRCFINSSTTNGRVFSDAHLRREIRTTPLGELRAHCDTVQNLHLPMPAIEIRDLRAGPQGGGCGDGRFLRHGWWPGRAFKPCRCDESVDILNCQLPD